MSCYFNYSSLHHINNASDTKLPDSFKTLFFLRIKYNDTSIKDSNGYFDNDYNSFLQLLVHMISQLNWGGGGGEGS